jgi:hypothetical protein
MPKSPAILRPRTIFRGEFSMSKPGALTLFCCLAALPLIGCANGVRPQSQAYPTPAPVAAVPSGARVYAAGPGGPAAILVMMHGPADALTAAPALWAAQGFDVVAPPASEIYQLAADRNAAFERLIASARAMADAPVWLVGPNPAIEAAMAGVPMAGPGQVSGVVVTSMTSGTGTCSERMIYSDSGNGALKVSVGKSGDACPAGSPFGSFGARSNPSAAPSIPAVRPNAPKIIEAAAPAGLGSPAAVSQIAELIKSASPD